MVINNTKDNKRRRGILNAVMAAYSVDRDADASLKRVEFLL